MISRQQIIGDKIIPEEFEQQLGSLLLKANMFCQFLGFEPMISSGFRSMEEHLTIYRRKGIEYQSKIPMASRHLSCQALDWYDPDRKVQKFVLDNQKLTEEIGLWFESFDYTPKAGSKSRPWVHMQSVQYGSWKPGKSIFFIPY